MGTRRRKRTIRKTRKKKGGVWTPKHNRIVAIRVRAKNHSKRMVDHIHGLVQELEDQYNGDAYRNFIKEQALKWSAEKLKWPQDNNIEINIIHDIARRRLKRKWMFHEIFKIRNEEAKNIANYMKIAANQKLSNQHASISSLSNQLQQQQIAEIEERIRAWKNEPEDHPFELFEFKLTTYSNIKMINPTNDMTLDDSIRITINEDQYPIVDEWLNGCNDLLLHFIKTDRPGIKTDVTPNPRNTNVLFIGPLYQLMYYVLKNYAYSLRIHANNIMSRRGGTFHPEDYKRCDKIRIRAAELYLEWKQYQLSNKFVSVTPRTVEEAQTKLKRVKDFKCSSPV